MNWFWRVYYFEAGADQPYRHRLFYTRAQLERALARFLRLGGDDNLKVIPPSGLLRDSFARP